MGFNFSTNQKIIIVIELILLFFAFSLFFVEPKLAEGRDGRSWSTRVAGYDFTLTERVAGNSRATDETSTAPENVRP